MTPESTDQTLVVRGAPTPDAVPLSERIQSAVSTRIRELLQDGTGVPDDLRAAMEMLDVLPLESDGDGWYGVRPTGDLIRFTLVAPHAPAEEEDRWHRSRVLLAATGRYPELEPLVPPPPLSSRLCPRCGGIGEVVRSGRAMPCACGGVGWLPPVSDPPPTVLEEPVERGGDSAGGWATPGPSPA